jgi:choline dehydrogenase-like flavoprotein
MGAANWTPPEVLRENILTPHLASTCRAGVDPKTSVVDSHFQCHDMENLFICDGSVLPRTSIGSLAMAIATVATFAAQRMVEDHFS